MFRFDTGGLENGVVNLINHMAPHKYRHMVLALTETTDFRNRIQRSDVEFVGLGKAPGHVLWQYRKLYHLFRKIRPAIVHTRNLGALEVQVPAWAAGVRARVHGEHGWDVGDTDGSNLKNQRIRRLYRPFVSQYVALSQDISGYLVSKIGVPEKQVTLACNGVDVARFHPAADGTAQIEDCAFNPQAHFVVGTVGRMQTVKNQVLLARAFVRALALAPRLRGRLRLAMVGDGPLRRQCIEVVDAAGAGELAWLPGERTDIPAVMRGFHLFVLPSLAEGISNTILEAMATGLPVVAFNVGGNSELVVPGVTGHIVPAGDVEALAIQLVAAADSPEQVRGLGQRGRQRAVESFSMQSMVDRYLAVYDGLPGQPTPGTSNCIA